MTDLPPRLTTTEVCALARISKRTFSKRRHAPGAMGLYALKPCDRGSEDLFERDAVLRALGMMQDERPAPAFTADPDAIRTAFSRQVRQRAGTPSGRNLSRSVRGSGAAPPVRLAFDATASP